MFYLLLFFTFFYLAFIVFLISGLFRHNILAISNVKTLPFISIIIAARNEENNLPFLIEDLVNQEYPLDKFEIIIINDRSSDSTPAILNNAAKNYSLIKIINIKNKSKSMTPKKNALSKGINIAKGEIILATDADCRLGKLWASSMAYSLINKNGIIIGYSEILESSGTFFEKYQRLDFLAILIANAGAGGWNYFWSGTGQNLAYFKKDFIDINGFEPVKNDISGDDMYLVQAISRLKNGYIHIDPNSYVKTQAMGTIKEFINQRIRWSSNSKKNLQKNPLFFLFLFVSLIENMLILFSFTFFQYWLFFFILKLLSDALIIFLGAKLFNRKINIEIFLFWAILQPIYIPTIGILGLKERFNWKP